MQRYDLENRFVKNKIVCLLDLRGHTFKTKEPDQTLIAFLKEKAVKNIYINKDSIGHLISWLAESNLSHIVVAEFIQDKSLIKSQVLINVLSEPNLAFKRAGDDLAHKNTKRLKATPATNIAHNVMTNNATQPRMYNCNMQFFAPQIIGQFPSTNATLSKPIVQLEPYQKALAIKGFNHGYMGILEFQHIFSECKTMQDGIYFLIGLIRGHARNQKETKDITINEENLYDLWLRKFKEEWPAYQAAIQQTTFSAQKTQPLMNVDNNNPAQPVIEIPQPPAAIDLTNESMTPQEGSKIAQATSLLSDIFGLNAHMEVNARTVAPSMPAQATSTQAIQKPKVLIDLPFYISDSETEDSTEERKPKKLPTPPRTPSESEEDLTRRLKL